MPNTITTTSTDKPSLSSSGINPRTSTNATTKAANLSKWLFQDIDFIEESLEAVKRKADEMLAEVQEERKKLEKLDDDGTKAAGRDTQLKEVKKKVSKLRLAIPFKFITPSQPHYPNINWRPRPDPSHIREITLRDLILRDREKRLSSTTLLSQQGEYRTSRPSHIRDITLRDRREYPSVVTPSQQIMLLCCLQFPPNSIIKRSILFGWMTAFRCSEFENIEVLIDGLIDKHFIKAVEKKSSLTVAGYRMDHSIHHTLGAKFYQITEEEICLGPNNDKEEDCDIFYTGRPSLGQFWAASEQFSILLHLGKWNKSSTQHNEFIDNPDAFFEKDVPYLTRLRYISLRGISMIQELPKLITKLESLVYLDVQACYNLEVIPSDIGNLRHTLRHLDMSECYFLDHMPKALATLDRLEAISERLLSAISSCEIGKNVFLPQRY